MGRLGIHVGKGAAPSRFQSGRQDSPKGKGRDASPGPPFENLASVKRAYRLFFFFDAFLVFFLPAFFFGFAFFAAFFRAGFFFPAFLARFFAAGFDAGFGASATSSGSSPTITSSSSSSTISSVSPPSSSSSSRDSSLSSSKPSFSISIPSSRGGIFGSGQKRAHGSLFWPELSRMPPRPCAVVIALAGSCQAFCGFLAGCLQKQPHVPHPEIRRRAA